MAIIRPLTAGELSLLEERMPRSPGTHRERFKRQQQGESVYLIAWEDGRPVGHLFLTWAGNVQERAAGAPVCPHLSDIAVHPSHRSQGIGSELMEAAERLVEQCGYDCVGLSVALDNGRARRLYERRGYVDAGIGEYQIRWSSRDAAGGERWTEETCSYLVKRLTPAAARGGAAPGGSPDCGWRILVFLHGTTIMHRSALGHSRQERVAQVKQRDPSVRDYAAYVPIGEAVAKLDRWQQQGAEIAYLSSHRKPEDVAKDAFVLKRFGFPSGDMLFRHEGESYAAIARRAAADVIVEDDCESIGGEVEMTYPHLQAEERAHITGIVVREFEGIDHLPDTLAELVAGCPVDRWGR